MERTTLNANLFLIVAYLLCEGNTAEAGTELPGSIRIQINQDASPNEAARYNVGLSVVAFLPFKITAPDGTSFGIGPGLGLQTSISSFEELSARFIGTWQLVETAILPKPAESRYAFTLGSFQLDDVHHDTPMITSPKSDSLVGPRFNVNWKYIGEPSPTQHMLNWGGGRSKHMLPLIRKTP